MKLTYQELSPKTWPDLEQLFGPSGACGGCWCMWWRRTKGLDWNDFKGAKAKRAFKKLVMSGTAKGLLAYDGGTPVAWCGFGPRLEFDSLARARTLKVDDAERVHSITCLFIDKDYRGRGVATAIVRESIRYLARHGARTVEAYPVTPKRKSEKIPAAFASTGLLSMYERLGFKRASKKKAYLQRVRKELGR